MLYNVSMTIIENNMTQFLIILNKLCIYQIFQSKLWFPWGLGWPKYQNNQGTLYRARFFKNLSIHGYNTQNYLDKYILQFYRGAK